MKFKMAAVLLLLGVSVTLNVVQLVNMSFSLGEPGADTVLAEEYVYVAVFKDEPMIKTQDEVGLRRFAQDYGVQVTIEAPEYFDASAQAKILEQVIARKPAGIMVCGSDLSLSPYIDKAIAQGIPTITVDADLPDSKRIAYVGSNWTRLGAKQAEAMAKLIGGKGKVAMLGMVSTDNMEHGFAGFRSVMDHYSDIVVLGPFDDMGNEREAQRITEKLIAENPDLMGIAGFDSKSAPGIVAALKKHELVGKIKVTSVDIAPVHLQLLREGSVQKLVGQKRELFTYYGGVLLYDLIHSKVKIAKEGDKYGITNIPDYIDTGLVEVDASNIERIVRGN